jgi:chromosome segregation ATPase
VKRKSNSPALSANKKMKSQGNHEKNKSGAGIDRKMPAAQLPLANIKTEEQDDWKKDIQEMSKAIKGLVEAQVKTNEKMSKLEKQIAKEDEDKEDKEDYVQDYENP